MTTLYEQDFSLWSERMAELLVSRRFDELDIVNLAEEIRDLSKRERDHLFSSLRLILHHLLKWDYQPELRSRSWLGTIQRERSNIEDYLVDSPSLKRYMTEETLIKLYQRARLDAIVETGIEMPEQCSYTLNDVMNCTLTL